MTHSAATFRARIRAGEQLVGTFVKTASHQVLEVLGTTGIDFAVIDAEHAPFDRNQLDVSLLAARAAGLPALVRLQNNQPESVLDALDMGANGLLVPHARSVAGVREVVAMARYREGVRGFSNSPRAGSYGVTGMGPHLDQSDAGAVVICQVEDREAVDSIEEIAAYPEVDCLFIGKADLAVSYRVFDIAHPTVSEAVERICSVCKRAGKTIGVFVGGAQDVARHRSMGASLFVVGSDQSLLRAQASALVAQFRAP